MSAPLAFVPLAILAIMGASTAWRWLELRSRAGIRAFVAPADSLLEWLFVLLVGVMTAFAVALAVHRAVADDLGSIGILRQPSLAWFGAVLGFAGALLAATAQFGMGLSWRIGVPRNETNALVTRGLYRLSRNPIYLGMLISLAGIFFVAPNALTLSLCAVGFLVMSVQIRSEEEFLREKHGAAFDAYQAATRRWI